MEKFKERLASVRAEVDTAVARAEAAEAKIKILNDEHTQKDHEITSQRNKLARADEDLARAEDRVAETRINMDGGETPKNVGDVLMRKVSLLESELDNAERNLRDTVDKLRQMDIKAEQFERKVQQLELEKAEYETKVEDLNSKYNEAKKEMDRIIEGIDGL
ncbi:hypothetical protein BGZ65_008360 [Modicella reniformis]|uniref:Tropomyosin n=1 Tax=Modicella reniformis TaxID=1440133 RepID=A0A9P6LWV3_9FUNG|nr:hypothetical protein BGZ65_008360 [Modicella reniformis]